jgi:surface carbohydrate biosynthesis protein
MYQIQLLRPKKVDAVIIDQSGSEWIKYCIPKEFSCIVVKIRSSVPIVKTPLFLYYCFLSLYKYKLSHSILIALVKILSPRVVITFIDNTHIMGVLQEVFPKVEVISVQNGMRPNKFFNDQVKYPTVFSFGRADKDSYTNLSSGCKQCFSVGSLKAGIFFNQKKELHLELNNAVCFISQYRFPSKNDSNLSKKLYQTNSKVFSALSKCCNANSLNMIVSSVNFEENMYIKEVKYFNDLYSGVNIYPNKNNLNSYSIAYSSNILVGMYSTLLFEMMALGKKVLFCVTSDDCLLKESGYSSVFETIPPELCVYNLDVDSLFNKIYALDCMGDLEYQKLISESKVEFMNIQDAKPHELISLYISNNSKQSINYDA